MTSQKKRSAEVTSGFTIIEVVLVLAIAGLIFLMVFVALPALQRSQRDTQRRNDMSRVDTSLVQYQTNHSNQNNNLPSEGVWNSVKDVGEGGSNTFPQNCNSNSACAFIRDYMNTGSSENDGKPNNFEDPDGTTYSLVITQNWSEVAAPGSISSLGTSTLTLNPDGNYTIGNKDGNAYDQHVIYIIPGGRCVGDAAAPSTKRHFAILYRLEGAGTYCIDDQ